MSGDSEVIREFLVSLGVEVNQNEVNRFIGGVEKMTSAAMSLGAAVVAAATTVAAGVVAISDKFEDLFYASQRLNASVANIQAFQYAASQMGATTREAMGSLEGLASFLRSNPGGENFIRSLGVTTRDVNGKLRDTTDIMKDLGARFRAMPYYLAKVRAGALGIDERTLQALIRGVDQFSDHYSAMVKRTGIDQQKAAEASHAFMQGLRQAQAELGLLLSAVLLRLQARVGPYLEKLEAWFDANFEKIADGIVKVAEVIFDLIDAFGSAAVAVGKFFEAADKATDGWVSKLALAGAAFLALSVFIDPVIAAILGLAAGVAFLIKDFEDWKRGAGQFDWSAWADQIDAVSAAFGEVWQALIRVWQALGPVGDLILKLASILGPILGKELLALAHGGLQILASSLDQLADLINLIVDLLTGNWTKAWEDTKKLVSDVINMLKVAANTYAAFHGKPPPFPDAENKPGTGPSAKARADALANPSKAAQPAEKGSAASVGAGKGAPQQAINFFNNLGWTREQAAGIVANLQSESNLNPNAVGDSGNAFGAAQWHKDRQDAFKRWAGHDIRQSTLAEQLAFVHHELTQGAEKRAGDLLRAAKTAREAGAIVSRNYERPADANGEAEKRGALAEGWSAADARRAAANAERLGSNNGRPALMPPATANSSNTTTVNLNQKTDVHVAAGGDPKGTAQAVTKAQERVNGNLLRNAKARVI